MRRLTLLAIPLALALGAATPAGAQIITVPKGGLAHGPRAFVSAGIGLLAIQGVFDGSTQSGWDFSQALEYHGSLELPIGRGSSFGATISYARPSLGYQVDVGSVNAGLGTNRGSYVNIDAHANVYTLGAQYAIGPGSAGFHQLIVINAGVIAFEKFHADKFGVDLEPKRDIDPRLAIAYGIGYGLKAGEAFLVQEYGVALHQSEGSNGNRRQYQQQTTRLGFRVGIGR